MKLDENLRIIWAITSKDIADAIKNKIVQGVFIGVAFLMLSSQALPFLMSLKNESRAFYWDQGKSITIKDIVRSRELDLYPRDNLAYLHLTVSQSAEPVLGIIIPSNFDEEVGAGKNIELQANYAYWVQPDRLAVLRSYFEEQLSARIGVSIEINTDGDLLYPPADGLGYPMMIAFGVVLGVMTVGLLLTPYLIVDEKDTHTIDALMVSPAKTIHLMIGKSLVGLFYSVSASLMIFVFSWRWVVHWDVMMMAVLLGGLSAVSLGLLVGIFIETPTNVNMVVALVLAGLSMSMYFSMSLATKVSPFFLSMMDALPSVAMYKIVRISFTEIVSGEDVWINSTILLFWIVVFLSIGGWRIRRLDR